MLFAVSNHFNIHHSTFDIQYSHPLLLRASVVQKTTCKSIKKTGRPARARHGAQCQTVLSHERVIVCLLGYIIKVRSPDAAAIAACRVGFTLPRPLPFQQSHEVTNLGLPIRHAKHPRTGSWPTPRKHTPSARDRLELPHAKTRPSKSQTPRLPLPCPTAQLPIPSPRSIKPPLHSDDCYNGPYSSRLKMFCWNDFYPLGIFLWRRDVDT